MPESRKGGQGEGGQGVQRVHMKDKDASKGWEGGGCVGLLKGLLVCRVIEGV